MDVNSIKYLAESPYPPTALGRYARWLQKESWRNPGEPIDRIGCIWTVEPRLPEEKAGIDDCTCIECGPEWGRVLIGWGQPRDEKRPWLPVRWPAGLFPLGISREHLVGWRGLVLAAVSYEPEPAYNYIPKVRWAYPREVAAQDDWECGWLALVRATRLLAHHNGLISNDRLLAPYPAVRYDAQPDVEPLLDELVRFSKSEVTPGEHPSPPDPKPVGSRPLAATLDVDGERPIWDKTARSLRFGGRVCKEYRQKAPAQILVLEVFEEEGWPEAIDDPLPRSKVRRKLDRTIESLNDRLKHIRFLKNGNGMGIKWRPV